MLDYFDMAWKYRKDIYYICDRTLSNLKFFKVGDLDNKNSYIKKNMKILKKFILLSDRIKLNNKFIHNTLALFDNSLMLAITTTDIMPPDISKKINASFLYHNVYVTFLLTSARGFMKISNLRPDIRIVAEDEVKFIAEYTLRDYSDLLVLKQAQSYFATTVISPNLAQILCFGCVLMLMEYFFRKFISIAVKLTISIAKALFNFTYSCIKGNFQIAFSDIKTDTYTCMNDAWKDIKSIGQSVWDFFSDIYNFIVSFFIQPDGSPDGGNSNGPPGGRSDSNNPAEADSFNKNPDTTLSGGDQFGAGRNPSASSDTNSNSVYLDSQQNLPQPLNNGQQLQVQ